METLEIRCPVERKHKISKDSAVFDSCGAILGGLPANCKEDTYFHCHICGRFIVAKVENGMLVLNVVKKGRKIDFKRVVRSVNDATD